MPLIIHTVDDLFINLGTSTTMLFNKLQKEKVKLEESVVVPVVSNQPFTFQIV